jgi:hypothetical protein
MTSDAAVSASFGIGTQPDTTYFRSAGNFAFYEDGAHAATDLHPGTNGDVRLVIETGGNVGIGLTDPAYKLDVTGDAHVTGAVTLDSTSTLTGDVTMSGAATVGTTLGVSGATTLSSTLGVTGATTLASVGVTGAATVGRRWA